MHASRLFRDLDGTTPKMVAEFSRRREQFVNDLNRVPGFHCQTPEGAFYAWVDIRGTGASAEEVCRILLEDAGVAAIPGAAFGPAGKVFVRFSFASSVANLKEATQRIMKASVPGREVWSHDKRLDIYRQHHVVTGAPSPVG